MDNREVVYKALTLDHPDRVPRHLWQVLAIEMFRPRENIETVFEPWLE